VFEEVDLKFAGEGGFFRALNAMAMETKRPIILTANRR